MFGKKNSSDIIIKYFKEKSIEYEYKNNIFSFNLSLDGCILNPYLLIDDNILSIMVNIRELTKKDNNIYEKLNNFNVISKIFNAKVKNNVIYLEYNTLIDNDNIEDIFDIILLSLSELSLQINDL